MDLKQLFGVESISDAELVSKIQEALNSNRNEIEIVDKDGKKITVKLPMVDMNKYPDPWPISSS